MLHVKGGTMRKTKQIKLIGKREKREKRGNHIMDATSQLYVYYKMIVHQPVPRVEINKQMQEKRICLEFARKRREIDYKIIKKKKRKLMEEN